MDKKKQLENIAQKHIDAVLEKGYKEPNDADEILFTEVSGFGKTNAFFHNLKNQLLDLKEDKITVVTICTANYKKFLEDTKLYLDFELEYSFNKKNGKKLKNIINVWKL